MGRASQWRDALQCKARWGRGFGLWLGVKGLSAPLGRPVQMFANWKGLRIAVNKDIVNGLEGT